MPRPLSFLPEGALVEVTCRTIQGRHLLRPTQQVRDLVLGVLGRAQRLYPVHVHAFVFTSNHYHLLLTPPDMETLARFMGYFNGNVARKIGKLSNWKDKIWSRRYTAIVVSEEEKAQVARLCYLLEHGCKENFILDPRDWPGAHAAAVLADDSMQLGGTWYNETKLDGRCLPRLLRPLGQQHLRRSTNWFAPRRGRPRARHSGRAPHRYQVLTST